MPVLSASSAFSRVTALAGQRPIHAAFAWLHANPKTIMDWQVGLVSIPAPNQGERERAEWLTQRFTEIGLNHVEIDAVGNVLGLLPAGNSPDDSGPVILLSAHIDTVFPAGTPIDPILDGDRLEAPGSSDNAAGVAGMLAIASALRHAAALHPSFQLPLPLVFVGNVGEEGEGDLRGVRHIYEHSALAGHIAGHIVLDGPGADAAVTQALGSLRFQVTITGPGGHSFTDAGTPNPIAALSTALAALAETPLPDEPRTTLNIGTIHGGISVNSIPESAHASIDFRSTDPSQLLRLEVMLHRAVEDAVAHWNRKLNSPGGSRLRLSFTISKIGDRPAAQSPDDSPMLATIRAVDRHLGLRTDLRLGSTDANIPLALGVPALSMGAGGEGGAAHTLHEWFHARERDLALKRVLLLTLAMLDWAAEQ